MEVIAVNAIPIPKNERPDSSCPDSRCNCTSAMKAAQCTSSCELNDQSFRQRAKDILTSGHTVTAGAVHLIGLDDIRESLEHRWESVRERVHEYTDRLLKKILSPQDIWFRHGDAQYIIVFAQADMQAAQLICAKIVENLHKALLGHSDTSRITVKTALMEIDGSIAVDTARLDHLLQQAAGQSRHAAGHPDDALHSRPESPAPQQQPERRQRPSLDGFALGNGPPPQPKVLFRPIFDVRNKVISTYTCRPDIHTCRYINQITIDDIQHEESIFDFDMETLCHAVSTYNELYANKFRYAQTIPVHFETIAATRRRREYLQSCRMIPSYLIPFLAFELEGLPQGIPYGRLAEIVTMLRPYGRATIVMLREETPDIPIYANAGIKGVGLSMDFRDGDQRCIDKIQSFCPVPRKHGMFAYVDGARNAAQLQAATEAGASYVGGAVVGEDSEFPEHMRRCTEKQMLMRAKVKTYRSRI